MKKIISTLAITLACFSVWATPTQPQTVQFVWPWASGAGGVATMMRHLVNAANQQQDRYQFVFTQKLGAGGAIAANYVLSSNSLAVIANGDAMYTRPLMYNEAHDITKFQVVSSICSNMPLALYSRKYTSIDQLKNKDATVGINPGTATQLLTSLIFNNAAESDAFKEVCTSERGMVEAVTFDHTEKLHQSSIQKWKRFTQGISKQ